MTTERQWIRTGADTLKLSGTRIVIVLTEGEPTLKCGDRTLACWNVVLAKHMAEEWAEELGELALEWKE